MHRRRNGGADTTFRHLEHGLIKTASVRADSEVPESPIKRSWREWVNCVYSEVKRMQLP